VDTLERRGRLFDGLLHEVKVKSPTVVRTAEFPFSRSVITSFAFAGTSIKDVALILAASIS